MREGKVGTIREQPVPTSLFSYPLTLSKARLNLRPEFASVGSALPTFKFW